MRRQAVRGPAQQKQSQAQHNQRPGQQKPNSAQRNPNRAQQNPNGFPGAQSRLFNDLGPNQVTGADSRARTRTMDNAAIAKTNGNNRLLTRRRRMSSL